MKSQPMLKHILVVSTIIEVLIASAAMITPGKVWASNSSNFDSSTQFYVAKPNHGAIEQIASLTASGDFADANLIRKLIDIPRAVWFTGGSPKDVEQAVKNTVQRASGKGTVPVLVAYNIPFRDCAQFSAGGATSVQEYKDWIAGFAAGIGDRQAVVILEPDGLGIIPFYKPLGNADYEWCQPSEADPATAATDRFLMLNYSVDQLKAHPNVNVYLDGTHSAWLGVGDAANRLVQAGIARADGFFLNVSNYQFTANLTQYGNWISECIAYATLVDPGNFGNCPNQYWNGGPDGTKIAELIGAWNGVALSPYSEWSDDSDEPTLNTSGINARYASMLGSTEPTTSFVIDTGRNGLGPWQPPAGVYTDAQDWCNPPARGLGVQPTANTGQSLLYAYLWVKVPGESDGECTRGLGPAGETVDPEWGLIDPPAGQWFPDMALTLAQNSNPSLQP